ncbi:hypothetical protein ACFC1R_20465 [Kitasatospora sp. NPDC056138]|uniref:hypothetical protein n=1 Tax=Kitasatospora sp. NPDC056138 TaxID=3345724 RepID=UPI0035E2F68A
MSRTPTVALRSFSMQSGTQTGEKQAALPTGADIGTILCNSDLDGTAPLTRQRFNSDFTLVSGTLPGPGGSGTVATAFSLADGRAVERRSDGGAGSPSKESTPSKESAPTFQAGTSNLWYQTAAGRLASRDLAQPAAVPVDHGISPSPEFVLAGDKPVRYPSGVDARRVAANPAGTVAAGFSYPSPVLWHTDDSANSGGNSLDQPLYLDHIDHNKHDGEERQVTEIPGASSNLLGCVPRLWINARSLLCTNELHFYRISFKADYSRITEVAKLLPESPKIRDAVLSPDGKALAYLKAEGPTVDLYRVSLAEDAKPVEVGPLPTNTGGIGDIVHLVAWQ